MPAHGDTPIFLSLDSYSSNLSYTRSKLPLADLPQIWVHPFTSLTLTNGSLLIGMTQYLSQLKIITQLLIKEHSIKTIWKKCWHEDSLCFWVCVVDSNCWREVTKNFFSFFEINTNIFWCALSTHIHTDTNFFIKPKQTSFAKTNKPSLSPSCYKSFDLFYRKVCFQNLSNNLQLHLISFSLRYCTT